MKPDEIIRLVQVRQGSLVITLPKEMANAVGIQGRSYVTLAVSDGAIMTRPLDPDFGSDVPDRPPDIPPDSTKSRNSAPDMLKGLEM